MEKSKGSQESEQKQVESHLHNHSHEHGQEHHHHHHDTSNLSSKKLVWVTLLNLFITTVQIVGGLLSHSLSLLSDAIHNLGDSSALFIAFLAGMRSKKKCR